MKIFNLGNNWNELKVRTDQFNPVLNFFIKNDIRNTCRWDRDLKTYIFKFKSNRAQKKIIESYVNTF